MKILYVITSTDVGGAEKALLSLVKAAAKEHEVKVISLKPFGPIAKQLEMAGAKEVISCNMTGYTQRVVSVLSAEIAAFQPDIVHAMLFRAIEFARMACAGKTCKLITTPHFDLSKKNFLLRTLDKLLKSVDFCSVAESSSTYNYLTTVQKYIKEKVVLIPNSPDPLAFFADTEKRNLMRQKYGYTDQETVFISVARLAPVKDPLTVLKAFYQVYLRNNTIRLVYVGEGIERGDLTEFITTYGLEKVVLLAGEQENINDWLNMADVFVLYSKEESLPLSLLEAVQVGKPCIVSRIGDMPLWVEQGKSGYVGNAGNETLLSCFMAEMADNPALRVEMAKNTLKMAAKIKDSALAYLILYKQIQEGSFHVKTRTRKKRK